jgi:murein DD-endopeptidase MepM/ murein hydrolase activator NlpD
VEFLNPFGTPVLAAADGKVVVAGTDLDPTSPRGVWPITFYGPYMNFYGNLVVIEHTLPEALLVAFPDMPRPIFTLYGHLSEIDVQVGQQVTAGQQIGKVGQAGIATGSHLHFEVRLGENTYLASRNPELYLSPHLDANGQPMGAISGRFLDSYQNSLEKDSIVLQHLPLGPDGPSDFQVTVLTYEEKGLIGQPPWLESFAVGDLPAGWYRISFPMGGLRQELLQVLPGQVTNVTFR